MLSKDKTNLMGILDAIRKIEIYTSTFSNADEFFNNIMSFDATMMNFIIIGEMVDRLSTLCKKENNHIDWPRIKGFRNLVAHDYFGIDAEEVWQIISTHIKILKKDIDNILQKPE